MKNILIKEFEGNEVFSFVWNGKVCWIATKIAAVLGYTDCSKTISYCIKSEQFEEGHEFDILSGLDLKEFKVSVSKYGVSFSRVPKIIIFYEDGLYGFLQFSNKPVAIEFKKWIRREVIPTLRQEGTYSLDNKDLSSEEKIDVDNMEDNLKDKSKDNLDRSLEKELIHSDDKIDDALDQFYNNGLIYNDFSDVRRKASYEREDVELKFSSSIKRVKVGRDGFDIDKFERIKCVTESARIFEKYLSSLDISDEEKFLFLKAIYEEAGMELPFIDL